MLFTEPTDVPPNFITFMFTILRTYTSQGTSYMNELNNKILLMPTVCKRDSRRNTKLSLTPKGCGAHGCGMWIVICHKIIFYRY